VLHQVNGIPLIQESRATLQVGLIQGMQQCVTGTVGRSTGTGCLATFTIVLGLTAKRALVDTATFRPRERQPHVIQFEDRLRAYGAHVFDRVLVTDVVRPLNGVVHVPTPIIIRIRTSDDRKSTRLNSSHVTTAY